MKVTDTDLALFARCPLGTFQRPLDAIETCAHDLLRWIVLEAFNGRQVPVETLRKKWVSLWNGQWPADQPRDGELYWSGIRHGRRLSADFWALFDKYVVLRPVQAYELPIGDHQIVGEYAVIGRRQPDPRAPEGPYVLAPHPYRPYRFSQPDLAILARWKHAMMSGEYVGLGVYHLPLLRGQYWRERTIAEPLVQPWLTSILMSKVQGLHYPVPGGHCEECTEKPCMRVFT